MDPLSLTASIIAVIGAGGAVAKCLRKLARVQSAPNTVLQLDSEICDLRLVVAMIEDRCRPRDQPLVAGTGDDEILCNSLRRTKDVVLELDVLLRYGLTKMTAKGERIDVVAWLRSESKVDALRERLRNVKMDLVIATGIVNMSSLHRLEACFQQKHSQSDPQLGTSCTTEFQTYALRKSGESYAESKRIVHTTEIHVQKSYQPDTRYPSDTRATLSTNEFISNPTLSSPAVATDLEIPSNPQNKVCGTFCLCTCHKQVHFRSPKILEALLGSLCLVYSSLLSTKPRCDDPNCYIPELSTVKAAYALPKWSINQAVVIQGIYTQLRGPELLLRVLRVRPNNSKIFTAIKDKNIVMIQQLLSSGEASVLDIDKRALYSRQDPQAACRVLLAAGADMMQEDEKLISPHMHVWMQIQRGVLSDNPSAHPPIGGLFGIEPDIERFGLPEIHATVLGYGHKTFDEVLVGLPRSSINDQDRMGYTALSLAAQSGNRYVIERLLLKGADPRIADHYGRTPIFLWIRAVSGSDDLDIIDLLVDKESINHEDDTGMTVLHYAIRSKRDSLLEHLKTRGVDINCRGHSGWTPLHEAVVRREESTTVIDWLLHNGADATLQDSHSRSPLMTAAKKRKHRALKLLLSRGVAYTTLTKLKRNLLHLVAIHGDLEGLEVLNHADLHLLCTEEKDSEGFTPMKLAVWRRDNNVQWSDWTLREPDEDPRKWFDAFETLCRSIENTYISVNSPSRDLSECSTVMDNEDLTLDMDEGPRRLPGSYIND